jgi:dimethylhistidine N-methyltransferase
MTAQAARLTDELELTDYEPETDTFLGEVVAGLSRAYPSRALPTAYLYDERGSQLFDEICELEEYYPTRTELALMEAKIDEMAAAIGPRALLVEYGSGSSIKTQILLEHLIEPVGYVPVDISREHLLASAEKIAAQHPGLEVLPVCADFTQPFDVPTPQAEPERRVIYFPGSTVGNFLPEHAVALMTTMADEVGPDGGLLIGVDLRKDKVKLEAAYDDAKGVTAEFNLNLLRRINRELGGDFDLSGYEHEAVYDESNGRIEMRLVSLRDQTVHVGGHAFELRAGERVHTEYSHKYTIGGFAELARRAGFAQRNVWVDDANLFSVHYYVRP